MTECAPKRRMGSSGRGGAERDGGQEVRARQEIRQSRGTHRKSSLFLWIIAQAGPSQYCPSACLSICLSFHLKTVLKPVWRYPSVPLGEAGLPIPRKLLIPLPNSLSLPTFPTEHLFKKKNLRKKERKKSHHHEWVTNTAGKIHGEHWWEGASSLTGQSATTVSYLHCSQTLCTAQSERGAPSQKQQYLLQHAPNPE